MRPKPGHDGRIICAPQPLTLLAEIDCQSGKIGEVIGYRDRRIRFRFPVGSLVWASQSLEERFSMTINIHHASGFASNAMQSLHIVAGVEIAAPLVLQPYGVMDTLV